MKLIPFQSIVLARKEFSLSYYALSTYAATAFFLVFTSLWLFYVQRFFALDAATLRPYFSSFPAAVVLVVPSLTMRAWAEERRMGTDELLYTLPFSEWDLVLGKFLGYYAVYLVAVLLTLPTPLSLLLLGRFDTGVMLSEYLGVVLLGSSAVSLGLLCSSLSGNQLGAFLGAFVALLGATFAHLASSAFSLGPGLSEFINYFSLSYHFESFAVGVLDSRALGFFLLSTLAFLFFTTRVILYRKWGRV